MLGQWPAICCSSKPRLGPERPNSLPRRFRLGSSPKQSTLTTSPFANSEKLEPLVEAKLYEMVAGMPERGEKAVCKPSLPFSCKGSTGFPFSSPAFYQGLDSRL